ncbi:MAG: sulfotransferase domain-containing protein [Paracoccaceae bacterium]
MSQIWLASYPRSGNTFLRTILNSCFGFKSGSIYPNDMAGNKALEAYVGHLEHSDRSIRFPPGQPPLIKTHELDKNKNIKTIYTVRNGLDSVKSIYAFYNQQISLERISRGEFRFGTWANHVQSWAPWDRGNTLFLRYEDLTDEEKRDDLLEQMAKFLGAEIKTRTIPPRDKIASSDGRFVRSLEAKRTELTEEQKQIFYEHNGKMMEFLGY